MTTPFDVPDGSYRVLVNASGEHCLWPGFAGVPGGWSVVHGPAARGSCLGYVNSHWTDLRPAALAAHLDASG
jgi:MbtH protein